MTAMSEDCGPTNTQAPEGTERIQESASREQARTLCQRKVWELSRNLEHKRALLRWLEDNRELPACVDKALWAYLLRE